MMQLRLGTEPQYFLRTDQKCICCIKYQKVSQLEKLGKILSAHELHNITKGRQGVISQPHNWGNNIR